jgi:SagB-type dehydrogenase family enzyme
MSDKLLWVLLPIAVAAAWVVWRAARGRLPSRARLNAVFSVLLALYVITTAGLGIFWVANQHLPVFDWHYVFGYALLILVCVHLGFNARALWLHLRPTAHESTAAAHASRALARRRPWLGALGGFGLFATLAASGGAFFLGLRQGRSEWRVMPAKAAGTAADAALARVEQYHARSSHTRTGLFSRAPSGDWGAPPPPFKTYAARPRIALDKPAQPAARLGPGASLGRAELAALLWHTVGVSERRGGLALRTAPSAGALFATELYIAVRAVDGLTPGLYHYDSAAHALVVLSPGALPGELIPDGVAAAIWATAIFRRSAYKYGERSYRYVWADLGHALENLRAVAEACGLGLRFLPGFDETRIAAGLRIDEAEEGVLAQAVLTTSASTTTRADPAPGRAAGQHGTATAGASAPGLFVLPRPNPAKSTASSIWSVIARRRSQRRFSARALALDDLSGLLAAISASPPQLSPAVRIDVLSVSVEGLAPGVWRHVPGSHALQLRAPSDARSLRERARAAALDQDVVGAAAVVFVLSIARQDWAADPLGSARGYRHAFLEAGMLGERVYLAAGARGLGVCAVGAFFDDEASALVQADPTQEWVVHFVALGTLD